MNFLNAVFIKNIILNYYYKNLLDQEMLYKYHENEIK